MPNILWFQPLQCETLLVFLVLYDIELKSLGFARDNQRDYWALGSCDVHFLTVYCENNCYLQPVTVSVGETAGRYHSYLYTSSKRQNIFYNLSFYFLMFQHLKRTYLRGRGFNVIGCSRTWSDLVFSLLLVTHLLFFIFTPCSWMASVGPFMVRDTFHLFWSRFVLFPALTWMLPCFLLSAIKDGQTSAFAGLDRAEPEASNPPQTHFFINKTQKAQSEN